MDKTHLRLWTVLVTTLAVVSISGQQGPPPAAPAELSDEPVMIQTAEYPHVRVVVVTKGLSHPWGLEFLPNGDMLVTERSGQLRVIRDGVLDPTPIAGTPEVYTGARLAGLMDIALHPRYTENELVYLTYSKPALQNGIAGSTIALARGRFDGRVLSEVRDVFVADAWGGGIAASRVIFGPDGMLYLSVGGAIRSASTGLHAQDPADHMGKLLRLRDDGSVPDDNPFVSQEGYRPEIFSMGHRNQLGLAFHPDTGELWASENGPQGGDEVNVVLPGKNYGWPVVSLGREYWGQWVTGKPWQEEMDSPVVIWWPSIAPSGLTFYTGDRFPAWQGNLFIGSLMTGRMEQTGHLERIVFNRQHDEVRREWLLEELKQRIRDVRQGPDGLLYLLTEEDDAAVLRLEPVD